MAIKDERNPVDGLFLNVDAAFDSEDFRNQCLSHGVFPNVCFNKRNGGYDRNELLIASTKETVGMTETNC